MFKICITFLALCSVCAQASTFTLTNNQSGATYSCSAGSGGISDPSCASEMHQFCDFNTNYEDNACFTKSAKACSEGVSLACVKEVFNDCDYETNLSDEVCFDQSLLACGGEANAIRFLIQAATKNTEEKLKNKK